ncbi:MAG: hypothetical protein CMJ21_06410 [Phycisphaerae bacterium]|jgi:hypothetical protein|nr:hypothetical protein [Phycisphaerae bacterium]
MESSTTMRKITQTKDVDGRPLRKGDTVATLSGNVTAKVCDLASDGGITFVSIRPSHQSYGRGIWHAADQVQRIGQARV